MNAAAIRRVARHNFIPAIKDRLQVILGRLGIPVSRLTLVGEMRRNGDEGRREKTPGLRERWRRHD